MSHDIASLQQATRKPAEPARADDRATEFVAVDGTEQYSGSKLMVSAYIAIWVILMAWIFTMWRKQSTLAERLDGLERALDRAAAEAEKKIKQAS
jgi:CcmD family protein